MVILVTVFKLSGCIRLLSPCRGRCLDVGARQEHGWQPGDVLAKNLDRGSDFGSGREAVQGRRGNGDGQV